MKCPNGQFIGDQWATGYTEMSAPVGTTLNCIYLMAQSSVTCAKWIILYCRSPLEDSVTAALAETKIYPFAESLNSLIKKLIQMPIALHDNLYVGGVNFWRYCLGIYPLVCSFLYANR